jgi:hypothetical protein
LGEAEVRSEEALRAEVEECRDRQRGFRSGAQNYIQFMAFDQPFLLDPRPDAPEKRTFTVLRATFTL